MFRFLIAAAIVTGVLAAACNDDDDDGQGATMTRPAATATGAGATPAATATAGAPGPVISIDAPLEDSTVTVPIRISGEANVFEAVLEVEVVDAAGDSVCRRIVMATSGTGTPGTWETDMAFDPASAGAADVPAPLTVRAFNRSARDGAIENVVERDLTLSPDLPNIVIESPRCNAAPDAGGLLEVTGTAEVFEAALTLELRDIAGNVVISENVTALSGIERAPFSATLDLGAAAVEPGRYDLVALSFSPRDGAIENVFSVPIDVVASP